jgi:hypothetical protein
MRAARDIPGYMRRGLGRAIRESGQALDRLGLFLAEKDHVHQQFFTRHRPIVNVFHKVLLEC